MVMMFTMLTIMMVVTMMMVMAMTMAMAFPTRLACTSVHLVQSIPQLREIWKTTNKAAPATKETTNSRNCGNNLQPRQQPATATTTRNCGLLPDRGMQGLLVSKGFVAPVGAPAIAAAAARPGRLHDLAMSLCRKTRKARLAPLKVQADGSAIGAMDHKVPYRQFDRRRS